MIIALILISAFLLRLVNLNQSLWLDEAVQALTAKGSLAGVFQEMTGDFHPPLYHLLTHFWVKIFGNSEISMRLPSVIFGVATVFIVYKLAMHMHSKFVAILSALLLATAPFHIYYSQEARMYSMATFLVTTSFYFLLKTLRDDKEKVGGGRGNVGSTGFYFLFTLLAVYTDYYAWLAVLAQTIFLLIKKQYKFVLITNCLLLIAYVPWFPMLITQLKTGMVSSTLLPEWAKLVNVSFLKALPLTLIKFTIGRITIFNKIVYGIVALGLFGLLGLLGLLGIRKTLKEKGNLVMILLWFLCPFFVSWLASLFIPNYQPFRLLLIIPAFYLLLAMGVERLGVRQWVGKVVAGLLLGINLVALAAYFVNPYFQREDWRGLVNYFDRMDRPKVLLPSSSSNWPIRYYDEEGKINLITGITGAEMLNKDISIGGSKKDSLYYIRYLVPVFDPTEKILNSLAKEGYTKVDEMSFNQLFVVKYQKQ